MMPAHLEYPCDGECETGGVVDQEVLRGSQSEGHHSCHQDEQGGPEQLLERGRPEHLLRSADVDSCSVCVCGVVCACVCVCVCVCSVCVWCVVCEADRRRTQPEGEG